MGLDIYVGTLTRYHLGDWETVVQRLAREEGLSLTVIRSEPEPDDAVTDPAVVAEAVDGWRGALGAGLGDHLSADFSSDERLGAPYFTDKPDWIGYSGLVLLAAHAALPQHPFPASGTAAFDKDEAYAELAAQDFRCAFLQVLGPELWLPVPFDFAFGAQDVVGNDVVIGSSISLLEQLRQLNDQTHGASEQELERARRDGVDQDGPFEESARFGLAMFLHHAELAVQNRLPMKLDY